MKSKLWMCLVASFLAFGGAGAALAAPGVSGTFQVQVNLTPSDSNKDGVCNNTVLSEQSEALVQTVCQTGRFVDISPMPGKPFLGTHGGAFRYQFRFGADPAKDIYSPVDPLEGRAAQAFSTAYRSLVSPFIGVGTVTGVRIRADSYADLMEFLVSY